MTISELRPCPFCGGNPALALLGLSRGTIYRAHCQSCDIQQLRWSLDRSAQIAAWNRRANDAPLVRGELRADLVPACPKCNGTGSVMTDRVATHGYWRPETCSCVLVEHEHGDCAPGP